MQYSLAYQLGERSGGLDPDAKAYIDAVVAAGATVSGGQKKAIDTFYKTGKSDGWYSSIKRMYLPIWASASPNAIDMIALGSGTFVGSVTHGAGFVTSDGSTGYFDVGAPLATIGCTLNSTSFGGLVTGTSATTSIRIFGVQDLSINTRAQLLSSGTTTYQSRINSNNRAISATLTEMRGVILSGRSNATTINVWQRVASGITQPINESAAASNTINTTQSAAFLANNNNGVLDLFAPATQQTGAMFIGTGFTNTEAEGFTLSIKNLWEGATGLTLP
jgi:hypothetical protein